MDSESDAGEVQGPQSPNSGRMVYTKLDGRFTPKAVLPGLLC
jgi:hypothetical protein